MATTSLVYASAQLALITQNVDIAGIGDAGGLRGSATPGSLYIALQEANGTEIAYTGYARQAIARSVAAWTRTNNVAFPAAQINFVACPSGTVVKTATKFAIYSAASGGTLLHSGSLTNEIPIQSGIIPIIQIGDLVWTIEVAS